MPHQATIAGMPGDLYYGDNLDILRGLSSESADLVYLDPPFNSDRTYNLLHKESKAQQNAFVDTWHWDDAAERSFAELTGHAPPTVRVGRELSDMMVALKAFLWREHRDTLAYLSMMGIRLVELHRVLRKTGSLYLHCDPTASHYLRVILDAIFGPEMFTNEIVWKRTNAHNDPKRFGRIHDVLLYYRKTEDAYFKPTFLPLPAAHVAERFNKTDEHGRRYKLENPCGPGPRGGDSGKPWMGFDPTERGRAWAPPRKLCEKLGIDNTLPTRKKLDALLAAGRIETPKSEGNIPMLRVYLTDEDAEAGTALQDIWAYQSYTSGYYYGDKAGSCVDQDVAWLGPTNAERLGYPTQKPLGLMDRIIKSSCPADGIVLDPFCGCGTTIESAEHLGRLWIGIDVAIRAIDVIKDRLDKAFPARRVWSEHGEPSDVEQAAHLAETNAYDFQWWAVRKLGGQPPKGEKKKGGDGGIDGELTLRDFDSDKRRRVIISVKGGRNLNPDFVKALKTTVDMEKADYGILITMYEPSQGMRNVARECGMVPWATAQDGKLGHRIRIITVPELFAGTVRLPGRNETPRSQSAPPPAEAREGETLNLPFAPRTPAKAKQRKPGPAKAYDAPPASVKSVAESARPKK